jgi:hypothetical protein
MSDTNPNGWPDAAARARRRVKALAMMGYDSMSAREVIEDLLDLWDYVHRGTGGDEILAALDAAPEATRLELARRLATCRECGRDRSNREPHKPGCSFDAAKEGER